MIPDYSERTRPGARPAILTVDRRDEFAEMYLLTTMTTREIAAHFGVSHQAVVSKWAQRLGLPLRGKGVYLKPRTPEVARKIVAARYAKYGPDAFKSKRYLGVPNYANDTVTRHHVKRKPFLVTPEQRARIIESTRKRWQDPEYRAVNIAKMQEGNRRRIARFWAQVEDPSHYRKVRATLGYKAAREAMGIAL